MRANRRIHSHGAGSPRRFKTTRAFSEREGTVDSSGYQKLSEEHSAEEECPIRAEWMVAASLATFWGTITGILALIEDAVATLVTFEDQKNRKYGQLIKAML